MAAYTFAMESTTLHCASMIDSGAEDYMLETAMLKVFATEAVWQIVNDTIQIYGGKAYFTDEPFERMMRDARINQIGEGANDVLRAFIAVAGTLSGSADGNTTLNTARLRVAPSASAPSRIVPGTSRSSSSVVRAMIGIIITPSARPPARALNCLNGSTAMP